MKESVESRALKIASELLQVLGCCRYDDCTKCRRVYVDDKTCCNCIRSFLMSKAHK